jgi:hypothetical protein
LDAFDDCFLQLLEKCRQFTAVKAITLKKIKMFASFFMCTCSYRNNPRTLFFDNVLFNNDESTGEVIYNWMIMEAGMERNEEEMAIAVLKMLPQHSSQSRFDLELCPCQHLLPVLPHRMLPISMIRWAGHVGCMGEKKHTGFWWRNLKGKDHLEYMGADDNTKMDLKQNGNV